MENLLAGLCNNLKKTHALLVITSFVSSAGNQEGWIFRPRRPGLVPFFLYALYRGSFLLRRDSGIKVIFGGSALVTPLVLLLARAFRRRALIYVHGSDLIYPNVLYQLLCVRWLGSCDRVIANSHYTASLAEEKGAKKSSICIISPGVDIEESGCLGGEEAKAATGLKGRKVLLYVGRLARRKGVKEFVEKSLPKIISEVPEACFVIVGENPTESLIHHDDVMGELKALVGDMRLENHVRLLGWLSDGDLAKVYRASDLMVLPVLSMKDDVEGFGIVLLEAAAAGLPAVATRVGGIPDAIEDGKSGILVDPEDYESMSRATVNLLRDDRGRVTLGECARKRVREEFSWERVVKKYEEILESLAGTAASEL